MSKNNSEGHIVGSGNVFQDLGFENADQELTKVKLASIIIDIIGNRGLNQKEAAAILGVNQPKVSALKNGRLQGFSIERLFHFLKKLDQQIEIKITKKTKDAGNHHIVIAHLH